MWADSFSGWIYCFIQVKLSIIDMEIFKERHSRSFTHLLSSVTSSLEFHSILQINEFHSGNSPGDFLACPILKTNPKLVVGSSELRLLRRCWYSRYDHHFFDLLFLVLKWCSTFGKWQRFDVRNWNWLSRDSGGDHTCWCSSFHQSWLWSRLPIQEWRNSGQIAGGRVPFHPKTPGAPPWPPRLGGFRSGSPCVNSILFYSFFKIKDHC